MVDPFENMTIMHFTCSTAICSLITQASPVIVFTVGQIEWKICMFAMFIWGDSRGRQRLLAAFYSLLENWILCIFIENYICTVSFVVTHVGRQFVLQFIQALCTDLKMSFPPNWQHIRDNFWFNFSAEFMFLLFIWLLIVLSILHVCGLFIVCLVRWSRHSNHNPCLTMLVYVCMLSVGVTTSIASTLIFGPSSVWRRKARRSVLLRDSNWHSLSNC